MRQQTAGVRTPRWPVVVFDLDGTLVDTVDLIVASYQHAFRQVLGREVPRTSITGWIGRPLIEAMRHESPEHADELYDIYTRWNREHTEELIRTYPGATHLLTELVAAGAQVAVATSKRREPATLALELAGLAGLVEVRAALEDTATHKPDPAPIRHALEALGVPADPATVVYVGDAVVDVQAGKAAGASAVAVTWGAGAPQELAAAQPTAVVADTAELLDLLAPVAPGDEQPIPATP